MKTDKYGTYKIALICHIEEVYDVIGHNVDLDHSDALSILQEVLDSETVHSAIRERILEHCELYK